MRFALAVVVAAFAAALGAVILGEYELTGLVPFAAALLFGIVVAEIVGGLSHRHDPAVAVAALGITVAGLVWAAWIQAGRDWAFVPTATWISVAVGGLAAGAWVRSFGRRAPRTSTDAAPPPGG